VETVAVISEVALSLVLLIGAGLMIRSFAQLVNISPGFDPKNVLVGRISFPQTYQKSEQRDLYVQQTLDRLKALPAVEMRCFRAPCRFSAQCR